MLIVCLSGMAQCGLSFRLDGYDLEACVTYQGFFSRASTVNLLCHLNWIYGETLCGREFTRRGEKLIIRKVISVNAATAACLVQCVSFSADSQADIEMPLVDCIQAINLRNFGLGDKDASMLRFPLTMDETARIVNEIAKRLVLIPALRAPTSELKAKGSSHFIISVHPPSKMHFTFQAQTNIKAKATFSTGATADTNCFAFPVINGFRGCTVGGKSYRKKCTRHAIHFTRCRCMLPIVSTPAHIEAISRALAPAAWAPSSNDYQHPSQN